MKASKPGETSPIVFRFGKMVNGTGITLIVRFKEQDGHYGRVLVIHPQKMNRGFQARS